MPAIPLWVTRMQFTATFMSPVSARYGTALEKKKQWHDYQIWHRENADMPAVWTQSIIISGM